MQDIFLARNTFLQIGPISSQLTHQPTREYENPSLPQFAQTPPRRCPSFRGHYNHYHHPPRGCEGDPCQVGREREPLDLQLAGHAHVADDRQASAGARRHGGPAMNRTILRIGAAAVVIAVLFPPFQHFLLDSRTESSKRGRSQQTPHLMTAVSRPCIRITTRLGHRGATFPKAGEWINGDVF